MFIHKLARLLSSLAIVALLAASCGGDTVIEAGASGSTSDTTEPTVPPASAAEPTAVPATPAPEPTASTAEADATETSGDDGVIVLENRDEAIAFIVSEGFVASDAECIVDGAYQVFGTWDFADLEPDPDQDEEIDAVLDACITVIPGPAAGSPPPGTDAELDVLWVACTDGSASACDDLFWQAPVDSDYEAFGLSCGGRAVAPCSDVLDG